MRDASARKASAVDRRAMISSIAFCIWSCSISPSVSSCVCCCTWIRFAIVPIRRVASDARISMTIQAEMTCTRTPGRVGMPPATVHAIASITPKTTISPQMTQTGAL